MTTPNHQPATYRPWTDEIWMASGLQPGITVRLARIDRALQGLSVISELLAQDFTDSQTDDEQPPAPRLPVRYQECLHAAAWTLHETAETAMQQLRDNEHDCWGLKA